MTVSSKLFLLFAICRRGGGLRLVCEDWISNKCIKGVSFWRNCGAASVGVLQDNLVLSTKLIMWIGHCNQMRKLMFQAFALHWSKYESNLLRQRGNARNVSFRISSRWPLNGFSLSIVIHVVQTVIHYCSTPEGLCVCCQYTGTRSTIILWITVSVLWNAL